MMMNEALEWAADYCERNKIFEAPKNERGYTRDGWTAPTPAEKARIITDLAKTVLDEPKVGDIVPHIRALWDEHMHSTGMSREYSSYALIHTNFMIEIQEQFGGR